MTVILGLNAYHADSSAAIVVDGKLVAAAEEERFRRVKHWAGVPLEAVRYCLKEAGISPAKLSYAAFYEKPFIKFERILETYLARCPHGLKSFFSSIPIWLKQKLWINRYIQD